MIKTIISGILFYLCFLNHTTAQPVMKCTQYEAREKRIAFTDSLYKNMDYTDKRSLRLGFWSIVAYNRWSPMEEKFITTLMKRSETLKQLDQYKLTAIVAKHHPSGWQSYLKKVASGKDNKLAVLACFNLKEAGITNIAFPNALKSEWKNVMNDLNEKAYTQTVGKEAIRQTMQQLLENSPIAYHIIVLVHPDRTLPAKLYLLTPGTKEPVIHGPFSYLLCSMYNTLPYFTYGDTPCGVYKIYNRSFNKNEFIGPTETLWTALPFELKPERWKLHGENWTTDMYRHLLPLSMKNSPMMWQAYRAGAVGRNDIILHGSTIDPENFKDKPFYPLTPSLGCLSGLELWDPHTGKRTVSHQHELMKLIPEEKELKPGYMYVIQVDDETFNTPLPQIRK